MSMRVLVADDNDDIRGLIEVAVRRAGLTLVRSVGNGRAALEAIGEGGNIDLAVLDVSMPELTGLGVLRALRELRPEHRPRVVLISASVDATALQAGIEAGADDYVVKPFSPRELAARLELLVGAWAGEAESR